MQSVSDRPVVRSILAKCDNAIGDGDLDKAQRVLATAERRSGPAEEAIAMLIEAMRAARAKDETKADALFIALDDAGVPLPIVLQECGRHFASRGDHDRAFRNFAMLETMQPGTVRQHIDSLPVSVARRFWPIRLHDFKGGPYRLPQLKREIIDAIGFEAAALIIARANRPPRRVVPVTVASLADWARSHSPDFRELTSVRQITLRSHQFLGQERAPDVVRTSRTMFTATLHQAVVSAKSNYILFPDTAVLDYQNDELARCPLDFDVDPVLLAQSPDSGCPVAAGVHALVPNKGEIRRVKRALSLLGIHSRAFGHWFMEFLPKLWCFMDDPAFPGTTILVDQNMPKQHFEALRLFVGNANPILKVEWGEQIEVDQLLVAPMPLYLPAGPKPAQETLPMQVVDPQAFLPLLDRALSRLKDPLPGTYPERIYLVRKPGQHRKLFNQPEVVASLERRGFVAIDFGAIPFKEQFAMIRSARTVIAEDGSAVMMSMLARADTRIGLLTHGFHTDNEWYAQVSHDLKQRILVLKGTTEREHPDYKIWFSDYSISLESLEQLIEALEA
jgi:hypothetical protein